MSEAYSINDYRSYELYHHGILGQKWGIRRYQNSDGTLTDEGRKRRQQIINQTEASKKVGKVVGGAIGGTAGVGASAAITLSTGFVIPYLQASITVGAAVGGAKAFESALQKIGDKRLADFDKKVNKERTNNVDDEINKNESKVNSKKQIDNSVEAGGYMKKYKEQFKEDVKKARAAKTDEEHDILERKADERLAEYARKKKEYTTTNKEKLLKNAREKDMFDLDFLEATQNDYDDVDSATRTRTQLKEYSKYLDDPEKYIREH